MILKLKKLPQDTLGIYTIKGVKNRLPERMLYLAPDAADGFVLLYLDWIRVSDMLRSAESSLAAVKAGRGAKMPGFSGHNFGFSIDIDVDWALEHTGRTKRELDTYMADVGWFCHRQDHRRGREDWHYNFFGAGFDVEGAKTTEALLEKKIQETYGTEFVLSKKEVQEALKKLKMYSGEIDGKHGPITQAAISAFQRAWSLPSSGTADAKTQRVLAFLTADVKLIDA